MTLSASQRAYFNLGTQLDALKKLNDDFGLELSLDKSQKPNKAEISEYVKRKTEKEQYADWERNAWETLRDRFRLMQEFKENRRNRLMKIPMHVL